MAANLICEECGSEENRVTDSRPYGDGIRRRRQCTNCGHRWTTWESTQRPNAMIREEITDTCSFAANSIRNVIGFLEKAVERLESEAENGNQANQA